MYVDPAEDGTMDDKICLCRHHFWQHHSTLGKCNACVCGQFSEAPAASAASLATMGQSPAPPNLKWTECTDCSRTLQCHLMQSGKYMCLTCITSWATIAREQGNAVDSDPDLCPVNSSLVEAALRSRATAAQGNVLPIVTSTPTVHPRLPVATQNQRLHIKLRLSGDVQLLNAVLKDIDFCYPLAFIDPNANVERCDLCNGVTWLQPNMTPHEMKLLAQQCGAKAKIDIWSDKCPGKTKWVSAVEVLESMGGKWTGARPYKALGSTGGGL